MQRPQYDRCDIQLKLSITFVGYWLCVRTCVAEHQSEEHIVLVLEYVSGGELFDYIVDNGRMAEVGGWAYSRCVR